MEIVKYTLDYKQLYPFRVFSVYFITSLAIMSPKDSVATMPSLESKSANIQPVVYQKFGEMELPEDEEDGDYSPSESDSDDSLEWASETERTIAEDELAEGKVDLVAECDVLDRDDLEDEEEDADVPTSFHEIIRKDLDAYILEIKQQVQERGFVANEPKIDLTLRESEIAEVSAQDFFDISR